MISKTTQKILVGFGVFLALIMAFFPTSSFLPQSQAVVLSNLKQQPYNEVGLYEISPFRAAEFYYYQPQFCTWIDIRDAQKYNAEHLSFATNMSITELEQMDWPAEKVLLIIGENTADAVQTVAELRQLKNVRAFAVQGGFSAVKKYLVNPITLDWSSKLSDQQLHQYREYRHALAGQLIQNGTISVEKTVTPVKRKIKPKAETAEEGC